MQLSGAREAELREEVASLRQEKKELQYNFCLLEEDNQALRGELQDLRGKTPTPQSYTLQHPKTFSAISHIQLLLAIKAGGSVNPLFRHLPLS